MLKTIILTLCIYGALVTAAFAQKTSIDIFGGPNLAVVKPDQAVDARYFRFNSGTGPMVGTYLNLDFDSTKGIRLGGSYVNKQFSFENYAVEGVKDFNVKINEKVESFNFSLDFAYTLFLRKMGVKLFAGPSYSVSRNNGGMMEFSEPSAEHMLIVPPAMDFDMDAKIHSFGFRGGVGLLPLKCRLFEAEFIYGHDFTPQPPSSYEVIIKDEKSSSSYSAKWRSELSYVGVGILLHLDEIF